MDETLCFLVGFETMKISAKKVDTEKERGRLGGFLQDGRFQWMGPVGSNPILRGTFQRSPMGYENH